MKPLHLSQLEITEEMNCWKLAFSKDTTEDIGSLYDEQASLWGTLSSTRRNSRESIKAYFEKLFTYSNRAVEFNDSNIRLFSNFAISSGMYTFSWVKNGDNISIAARYSFVYINKQGRWLIVEHHSSRMPKTA